MDPPTTRQQQQHRAAIHNDTTIATAHSPSQQQAKRKPLTVHPPPPSHTRTTTTTSDVNPRRSSSISSQTSGIFSHGNNGLVSSSSSFLPSSPLFRSGYNKLGGSAVGMGTVVGSMSAAVGVGSSYSPFLGQQSLYGTSLGHRGFSSSTLSLLSSHPSSPGASPASGAFFSTETRRSFDMEAIDVSESEGEQDVVVSIDGDDESESSGSEEGDDVLLSISVRDDSDNEDQENSSIESPISTYDPIPAASLLSSSTPSPSMMAGRLGLFGGVQQQTYNEDNSRRSQEIGRQGRSYLLQDSLHSHDHRRDTALVLDVHAAISTTVFVDKDEERLLTVSAQDTDDNDNDNDAAGVGSAPSPALSHSTPAYSAQSTPPSSHSLSGSPYPLDSEFIPGLRLLPALSSSSSVAAVSFIPDTLDGATNTSDLLLNEPESTHLLLKPLDARIPASAANISNHATSLSSLLEKKDEQDNNVEPHLTAEENLESGTTVAPESTEAAYQNVEGLLDEGVFEDEEDNSRETLEVIDKSQDVNTRETIEAESHPDGYGSLPKYSTYPVQQQHDNVQDLSSSSSNSDAVVAELKEVRTILQDLHKRMDRLERSLHATSSSSGSEPQKDRLSSPVPRRRGVLSIIMGMATPRQGGGGGGLLLIAIFVLFVGLIVFGGRRRWTRRRMRSLLRMDWATAKQLARSRLSFLERHVSRLRLH